MTNTMSVELNIGLSGSLLYSSLT